MYRTTLAGAAVLAGVTLAACSSGSSGTAALPAHTAGHGSRPVVVHSTSPVMTRPSAPVGGGGSSWCGEIEGADASMLKGRVDPSAPISPQDEQAVQKLAADAPAAIRGDVQTLVNYEIALSEHKASDSSAQHYFRAATHVAQWLQTNCPALFQKLNPGVPSLGSS